MSQQSKAAKCFRSQRNNAVALGGRGGTTTTAAIGPPYSIAATKIYTAGAQAEKIL